MQPRAIAYRTVECHSSDAAQAIHDMSNATYRQWVEATDTNAEDKSAHRYVSIMRTSAYINRYQKRRIDGVHPPPGTPRHNGA